MSARRIGTERLRLKRVYEPPAPEDGVRILVDRLWPRGLSKAKAAVDQWMKDIAPSAELRKWFGHDPERWAEFRRRYREELRQHPDLLDQIRALARDRPVTLVFGAHDERRRRAEGGFGGVLRTFSSMAARRSPAKLDRRPHPCPSPDASTGSGAPPLTGQEAVSNARRNRAALCCAESANAHRSRRWEETPAAVSSPRTR